MNATTESRRPGRIALVAFGLLLFGWSLACAGKEEGERAQSGECPTGEVCSDATPEGLVFVGEAFYDSSGMNLGPIAKGGRFDLGVYAKDGADLPAAAFLVEDESVLAQTTGSGTFNDGNSQIPVDAYVSLRGLKPGTTYVRVVDPDTGELFDRLALTVVAVGEIRLTNAHDPDQPFHPGQEGALGVQIIGKNGSRERAFDLDMKVVSPVTEMAGDPSMWDCFLFTPPMDAGQEMEFEVTVGDVTQKGTMPVAMTVDTGTTDTGTTDTGATDTGATDTGATDTGGGTTTPP